MNAERMREIGRDMQKDADPTIQAAAEFVLDVAADTLAFLEVPDVIDHAVTIASRYAEDPGPVPGEAA